MLENGLGRCGKIGQVSALPERNVEQARHLRRAEAMEVENRGE
jgi:hypothetical protein